MKSCIFFQSALKANQGEDAVSMSPLSHLYRKLGSLTLASGGGGLMQPPPMSFSELHAKPFGVSC